MILYWVELELKSSNWMHVLLKRLYWYGYRDNKGRTVVLGFRASLSAVRCGSNRRIELGSIPPKSSSLLLFTVFSVHCISHDSTNQIWNRFTQMQPFPIPFPISSTFHRQSLHPFLSLFSSPKLSFSFHVDSPRLFLPYSGSKDIVSVHVDTNFSVIFVVEYEPVFCSVYAPT